MRYSTLPIRSFLKFSSAGLLALLSGCTPTLSREEADRIGLQQSNYLIERYGELGSPEERAYITYLETRLINGFHKQEQDGRSFKFVLIDGDEPMAFSPGAGYVIFSKGLVKSVRSEAELAFALAHELSHQYLGHTEIAAEDYKLESYNNKRKELELEADSFALGVVAIAGYDPRLATSALLNAYRRSGAAEGDAAYPDLQARLENIIALVQGSGWRPPGTVNRRAFHVFQASLG